MKVGKTIEVRGGLDDDYSTSSVYVEGNGVAAPPISAASKPSPFRRPLRSVRAWIASRTERKRSPTTEPKKSKKQRGIRILNYKRKSKVDDESDLTQIQKILHRDMWSEDEAVVKEALSQLDTVRFDENMVDKASHAVFVKAVAVPVAAGMMMKWRCSPEVQAEGCHVLMKLCQGTTAVSAKATGALEAIIWAMENYSNDEEVQRFGCGAIANVGALRKDSALYLVNELHAVKYVISAMKKFRNSSIVQMHACFALSNLSNHKELRQAVIDVEGLEMISTAIRLHQDETNRHIQQLQMYGRSAMRQLCETSDLSLSKTMNDRPNV